MCGGAQMTPAKSLLKIKFIKALQLSLHMDSLARFRVSSEFPFIQEPFQIVSRLESFQAEVGKRILHVCQEPQQTMSFSWLWNGHPCMSTIPLCQAFLFLLQWRGYLRAKFSFFCSSEEGTSVPSFPFSAPMKRVQALYKWRVFSYPGAEFSGAFFSSAIFSNFNSELCNLSEVTQSRNESSKWIALCMRLN